MKGWHNESNRHALAARGIKTGIPGGLAEKIYPDLNPAEWVKGIEIEMEHTNDIYVAAEIALDHLSEDPDYYTKLEQMEMEAGGVAFKPGRRGSITRITSQVCNTRIDMAITMAIEARQHILTYHDGDPRVRNLVGVIVGNFGDMGMVCSSMHVDEYHYKKFIDIVMALDEFHKTGMLLDEVPTNLDVAYILDGAAYSLENAVGWKGGYR